MSGNSSHADVAAYALGTLDADSSTAFEAHLLRCRNCQVELYELQEVTPLLDVVARTWPNSPRRDEDDRVLRGLLRTVADQHRGRGRRRWLVSVVGLAAVAAMLAGGTAVVLISAFQRDEPVVGQEVQQPPGLELESSPVLTNRGPALNPKSVPVLPAKAWIRPTRWGSQVELDLGGITGPARCSVVAISRAGSVQEISAFDVPADGFGVDGSDPVRIAGGTTLSPDEIDRVEVREADSGKPVILLKAPQKQK